jgi:SNF2 family DNA or RNA helicase
MGHLKTILNQYSLRRTKDLLNLPAKNVIDEFVEMESAQEQFYDNVRRGIKDQVDKVKLTPGNLLAMVTRLRQATDLPNILTTENIPSAKVERCIDLCEQILSDPNEKVVIFSMFKETLNYISHRLIQYNPLVCHGDIPDEIVSRNIDEFQTNNFNRILICTTQKMGTGVTLNRAHYSIFISSEWTAGIQEQCEDRIHRINNDGAAFIYRLWTKDTFDERNLYLINLKGAISDYIVDDKVSVPHYNLLKQFITEI